jgi:hypothetical protein
LTEKNVTATSPRTICNPWKVKAMKVVIEEIWKRVYTVPTDDPEQAAQDALNESDNVKEIDFDYKESHMVHVYSDEDRYFETPLLEDVIATDIEIDDEEDTKE